VSVVHFDDLRLGLGDVLVLIDAQNDFLAGGSLAVRAGDEIIPILNHAIDRFSLQDLPIFATRDWHPQNHCSFQQQGGPWPPHCVQGTAGAQFSPNLRLPPSAMVISKGIRRDKPGNSGFEDTDLEVRLLMRGARHLFVGGIATDYCVLHTVRDALHRGFRVSVMRDAVSAVNVRSGDGERALAEMRSRGADLIEGEGT
jgi:nicotinamidase/pyrazinamidase